MLISTTVAPPFVTHGGPALSAFLIFQSSEWLLVVKVLGGSGSVAVERSSANAVVEADRIKTNARFSIVRGLSVSVVDTYSPFCVLFVMGNPLHRRCLRCRSDDVCVLLLTSSELSLGLQPSSWSRPCSPPLLRNIS